MVKNRILLDFPYTSLDFLILILCLILFLKYILRAENMRDIIIFLLLRPLKFLIWSLALSRSKKNQDSKASRSIFNSSFNKHFLRS